jgi:protoheme IX farnesyltransferase
MISRLRWTAPSKNHALPLLYILISLLALIYIELSLVEISGFDLSCRLIGGCGSGPVTEFLTRLDTDIHGLIQVVTWPSIFLITGLAIWISRGQGNVTRLLFLPLLFAFLQSGLVWVRINVFASPVSLVINQGLIIFMIGSVILVALDHKQGGHSPSYRLSSNSKATNAGYSRFLFWTGLVVFTAMVSGALATAGGGTAACVGWPFCDLTSNNPYVFVQQAHRFFSAVAAVMVAWAAVHAWRRYRSNVGVLIAATSVGVLYVAQGLVGAMQAFSGSAIYFSSLHSATSIALWGALVMFGIQVGFYGESAQGEGHIAVTAARSARDFLLLTKPIVVLLLLFTTYGGMVVAARAWPGLDLTMWTLIGGALAAGGSSAVNQYIDRDRDKLMVRTAKRPIAAGRLTPAEGLAFGVALCLGAFYLLATFVNLLAALLAVAGMFYYVVLYSILLKHATVQNIVIGGGAGAIPPLVGWAAVTGGISWAAVTLFVVIFLWTPPHFWALAIVKRKDYEKAEVPMLPVVRGEQETRWQIFLYTLILVGFTLTLPFFGLGSWVYWAGAVLLGLWLIRSAGKVWQGSGNKVAWTMYRHSSMYLAFLFLVLMIDAVV